MWKGGISRQNIFRDIRSYGFNGEYLVIIFFSLTKEEKAFWSVVIYFISKENVRLGWYEAYKSASRFPCASARAHDTKVCRNVYGLPGK